MLPPNLSEARMTNNPVSVEWHDMEGDSVEKYNRYLCSREWAEKRRAVFDRANGVCERCQLGKVDEIHHLTYLRKYLEHLDDLQGLCSFCHEFVHGFSDFDSAKTTSIGNALADAMTSTKLLSGFKNLDVLVGGFRAGELIVLASRPCMGKSALAINIADYLIEQSQVLLFTPDSSRGSIVERFLAVRSKVNLQRIRNGTLDAIEMKAVKTESDRLRENNRLQICDQAPLDFARIQSIVRQMKESSGLDLLIIDYINILSADGDATREQQISDIARKLKLLAKVQQIPVLCLAELGRSVELREDKRPRLSDIRESGTIEETADTILLLHRPAAYDPRGSPR